MSVLAKSCPRCGEQKPITRENWYFDTSGKPTSYCKDCAKEYQRERRARFRSRKKLVYPDRKSCPDCGEIKSSEEFYRKANAVDGLHDYCKVCTDRRYKEYYRRKKSGIARRRRERARETARGAEPGYVYLAYMAPGYYKIGKSVDPVRRIKSIDAFVPFDVELLHKIETNQQSLLELYFHTRYADKRVDDTEWFLLTDDDVHEMTRVDSRHFPVDEQNLIQTDAVWNP